MRVFSTGRFGLRRRTGSTFSKNVENRDVGRNRVTMFCVSRPPLEVTKEMGSCQARRLVRNFAADLVGPLPGLQDVKNGPKTSKNIEKRRTFDFCQLLAGPLLTGGDY